MTIFLLVGCACVFAPDTVAAQGPPLTTDSHAVDLDKGDKGTYTASLGFTNLSGKEIVLTAKPATAEAGCSITLAPDKLPPAEHTDVTATVQAGCTVDQKKGIKFTASSTAPVVSSPVITAAPKPEPQPNWDALWAFPAALVACLLISFTLLGLSSLDMGWRKPLKYLDPNWDFKESWVTNVTALGGLIAGLFGSSDVVRALIGKDADSSVTLATVGAAAALFFVGAGPIVLLATKTKSGNYPSVFGLLVGSAVTLAGAFGEIWVVYKSGSKLDLGGWQDRIVYLAGFLAVLLAVYAFRTLRATLVQGERRPRKKRPRSHVAAKIAVQRLAEDGIQTGGVEAELEKVVPDYKAIEPTVTEDYPPPRRSAVL